jgi:hypothetical protein
MEYLRDGNGPPEITEPQPYHVPVIGNTSVCVQFPFGGIGGMRRIQIYGVRGLYSSEKEKVTFRRRNLSLLAPCPGEMKPFVELQQVAQKLKACRDSGETRCEVFNQAGRRDTMVFPAGSF